MKQLGELIAFRRGDLMAFCERMRLAVPEQFPGVSVCDLAMSVKVGVHFNPVAGRDGATGGDSGFEKRLREWGYDIMVREYQASFGGEHAIGR